MNQSRRGFAFLVVLLLMVVASVIVAVALQRAGLHAAITERQIIAYRQHHEMLGIRDYCDWWLGKRENDEAKLSEYARANRVAHRLALDNGVVVLISVIDGQGTLLRNLENVEDEGTRRWTIEMLARLPEGRTDLTRRSGKWPISFNGAPEEIIFALAGSDPRLGQLLLNLRDQGIKDQVEFQMALERANIEPLVTQALLRNLTFTPSLWRLNVEVVHPDQLFRYTLLVEKINASTKIQEWRAVSDQEAQRLFTTTVEQP